MNTPHLTRLAEFKALLQGYQISPAAQRVLSETPLVLLLASTATGRNTIISQILQTGRYHFIVSDTTRPPRVNDGQPEQNGIDYFFRTEDEMLQQIKDGRLIEAEIIHGQQVSGTSIRELEKAQAQHKTAIRDIDLGGSLAIASVKKDAKLIFIVPPSFKEWLRRITTRNNPSPTEIKRRLYTAARIFRTVLSDDRFQYVVNDDLDQAVSDVDAIARTGQSDPAKQQQAREITQQLLADTQAYLQQN